MMGSDIDGGGRGRGPCCQGLILEIIMGLIRWGNTREPAIGGRGRGGVKRFCSKLGSSAFQAPPGG